MELFDDHWGSVGSIGRSVTERTLTETWVSLVGVYDAQLFDATAGNLSKVGTDAQLLTGDYATTRDWSLRMMQHPAQIDGVYYRSRHDPARLNGALFGRNKFVPPILDADLIFAGIGAWARRPVHGLALIYGPAIRLRDHPLLDQCLVELQVGRLP